MQTTLQTYMHALYIYMYAPYATLRVYAYPKNAICNGMVHYTTDCEHYHISSCISMIRQTVVICAVT